MKTTLNLNSIDDYRRFLAIKSLPRYAFNGREAWYPDEYAHLVGGEQRKTATVKYKPLPGLFDYQRDIAKLAIRKQRFAVFADCGLGKTLILIEYLRHVASVLPKHKKILIVSPLMVVSQTLAEVERFYGDDVPIEKIAAKDLQSWLHDANSWRIGITNYDALTDDITQGNLGCLILDESSMLKSMYGKWGQKCIELGRGLEWKLCATGTPAPNDRIEYGNHAVFLDQFPTLNAFLAKYFVNRGQTDNRWEMKPHALGAFYRAISHWCIFLSNPAVYGWKDNCGTIPPINIHVHDVELTDEQNKLVSKHTGELFVTKLGGIVGRSAMGRIAKGKHKGQDVDTRKPAYIKELVDSFGAASTVIWCLYNDEQDKIAAMFDGCANISGDTPLDQRMELIADFKDRQRKVLVSKSKILGFGLNLQCVTKMVFSGLQDSYESFYQCIKRANRYGSTEALDVHIPATEIELPMIETVLAKANRVQADTEEQERIFKQHGVIEI